jgi:tetratricopeptide (TPR) repeat protein
VARADSPLSPRPDSLQPDLARVLAQALALHQQGHLAEAERLYRAILAAQPDHADALHFLGLIRFVNGAHAEALRLIAQAMRAHPPSLQVLLNHGIVLNALNRPLEAVQSFERAIALDASCAEAHNNRGVVLAALGRNDEALESYRAALAVAPDYAEAHFNRGNALKDLGRLDEALDSHQRAVALRPDYAEALANRGFVLQALGRFDEALASCDGALALRPDIAEAHSNRGNVLKELKRFAEALTSYDRAVALRPDYPEAHSNRGHALHELERFEDALASFERALALRPDHVAALTNRAATLHALKRFDEALESCARALALRPDDVEALLNHGTALSELGRNDAALAAYDRALAVRPDMPEVHWNQATLRLLTGDFARGWAEYEWRWKREAMAAAMRDFARPLWRGEELAGKTVLLHSEQGFGDAIQFCRYAPLVAARGAQVILEVEKPLQALMQSLAGPHRVIAKGEPLPDFDMHCPLMSLPLAFDTQLETIPATVPYLHAPAQKAAAWRERLADKPRPLIGLAWSGNAAHPRDRERSMALHALAPVLDVAAGFVSLQKDVRSVDAAALAQRGNILQVGDMLGDFSDTAALVAELDLVIAVDTAVVHLAGALGKPVWILVQATPDWRWLLARDDSPWYPTARLFRQDATRTWDGAIARVRDALRQTIAEQR